MRARLVLAFALACATLRRRPSEHRGRRRPAASRRPARRLLLRRQRRRQLLGPERLLPQHPQLGREVPRHAARDAQRHLRQPRLLRRRSPRPLHAQAARRRSWSSSFLPGTATKDDPARPAAARLERCVRDELPRRRDLGHRGAQRVPEQFRRHDRHLRVHHATSSRSGTRSGPSTDVVLLAIGGNDVNFSDIVKQCFVVGERAGSGVLP